MSLPVFTLAGDVGFGINFLAGLLVVLVGIAVFFMVWAIYTTRHPRNADKAAAHVLAAL